MGAPPPTSRGARLTSRMPAAPAVTSGPAVAIRASAYRTNWWTTKSSSAASSKKPSSGISPRMFSGEMMNAAAKPAMTFARSGTRASRSSGSRRGSSWRAAENVRKTFTRVTYPQPGYSFHFVRPMVR